jgi:hypothetical protein
MAENGGLEDIGIETFEYLTPGPVPSCRDYTMRGNVGYIAVRALPTDGSMQWGAYMYAAADNYGPWWAWVSVNGVTKDNKLQVYPPHGSLVASQVPPGSLVSVSAIHIYARWITQLVYIPEFGWRTTASWIIMKSGGTATCMMPAPWG